MENAGTSFDIFAKGRCDNDAKEIALLLSGIEEVQDDN